MSIHFKNVHDYDNKLKNIFPQDIKYTKEEKLLLFNQCLSKLTSDVAKKALQIIITSLYTMEEDYEKTNKMKRKTPKSGFRLSMTEIDREEAM